MAYDIRPLSFSEILDRAIRVLLDNFFLLFGIAAMIMIPSEVLLSSGKMAYRVTGDILLLVFLLVAAPVMHAALVIGAASVYLDRPISVRSAYESVRPIVWPIVRTYFLYELMFFFSAIAIATPFLMASMFFAAPSLSIGLCVLALLALIAAGGYFLVAWSLIGSVTILERRFGRLALRRSSELVRGSWWQTLGIVLTVFLIANAPALALRFIWGFIPVIGVVLRGMTQSIISAYGMVAFVIYYFDRRCRTEDFDLRLLAEQVRSDTQAVIASAPIPSLPA